MPRLPMIYFSVGGEFWLAPKFIHKAKETYTFWKLGWLYFEIILAVRNG